MTYFVVTNSFAAPFCSDTGTGFVDADTPEQALYQAAATYTHPARLYAALAYTDANAYHRGEKPLAKWLCNHEIEKERTTGGQPAYMYRSNGPGDFEIDNKRHVVADPLGGRVVELNK